MIKKNREIERNFYKGLGRCFDLYADDGDSSRFRMRLGGLQTKILREKELMGKRQTRTYLFNIQKLKRRFL